MSKRLAWLFVVSGILFDSVVNFPTLAQSPQLSQPSNANNPFVRVENDFKIELKGCQRKDINVTCSLLITNQGIKERGFGINGGPMLRSIRVAIFIPGKERKLDRLTMLSSRKVFSSKAAYLLKFRQMSLGLLFSISPIMGIRPAKFNFAILILQAQYQRMLVIVSVLTSRILHSAQSER